MWVGEDVKGSVEGMGFEFTSRSSEDLLVRQRSGWSSAKGRLKREDCELVKHDKLFSEWKILVDPSDWNEHGAGISGIDLHRTVHNLPAAHFQPAVYELGVTAPSWSPAVHRQRSRTLKREDVMAVYVGHADDVRLRLQNYGQGESHLEGSRSLASKLSQGDNSSSSSNRGSTDSGSKTSCSGPRLFWEVFGLGSSIAFRWAQTDSKVVAQQVKSELLTVFDYAWNKGNNGSRRSSDILAKLFMAGPAKGSLRQPALFSSKKYIFCGTNPVGIKVALRKPMDPVSRSNKKLISFTTTNPPVEIPGIPRSSSVDLAPAQCSALIDLGTPCNTPALKGRKRCLQHKGMRVGGSAVYAPLLRTRDQQNVKRECVKVGGGGLVCIPGSFLRRSLLKSRPDCSADSKPGCKEQTQEKTKGETKGESKAGRRQLSLSFSTWMKMEIERVHDSQDSPWSQTSTEKEELYAEVLHQNYTSAMSKHRVREVGAKCMPVIVNDSQKR